LILIRVQFKLYSEPLHSRCNQVTQIREKIYLYNLLLTVNFHLQVQMQSAKEIVYTRKNSNNSGSKEIALKIILGYRRLFRCWLNFRQEL